MSCLKIITGVGEILHDVVGCCRTKPESAFVVDKGDSIEKEVQRTNKGFQHRGTTVMVQCCMPLM